MTSPFFEPWATAEVCLLEQIHWNYYGFNGEGHCVNMMTALLLGLFPSKGINRESYIRKKWDWKRRQRQIVNPETLVEMCSNNSDEIQEDSRRFKHYHFTKYRFCHNIIWELHSIIMQSSCHASFRLRVVCVIWIWSMTKLCSSVDVESTGNPKSFLNPTSQCLDGLLCRS